MDWGKWAIRVVFGSETKFVVIRFSPSVDITPSGPLKLLRSLTLSLVLAYCARTASKSSLLWPENGFGGLPNFILQFLASSQRNVVPFWSQYKEIPLMCTKSGTKQCALTPCSYLPRNFRTADMAPPQTHLVVPNVENTITEPSSLPFHWMKTRKCCFKAIKSTDSWKGFLFVPSFCMLLACDA